MSIDIKKKKESKRESRKGRWEGGKRKKMKRLRKEEEMK